MKDQEIRKILLEYIKTRYSEVRIYQEKSIGSSICDVMTATDRLTGYEIKSDADDYTRLHSQIVAYDAAFDENYIVVSKCHAESAAGYIPRHWGILCILDDNITLIREAQNNPRVQRKTQLMILWKLELKNILVRNDLPMYAQKEKSYIAERIIGSVSHKELRGQIAYELLHRDYSIYDAEDYTVHSKNPLSGMPEEELIDSLSEQDLSDVTLDQWIALYRRAKKAQEKKNSLYLKQPENRTEHKIPFSEIEITLGVPWISEEIINLFANHLWGRENYITNMVSYTPLTGYWYVDNKKTGSAMSNPNLTVRFGTSRYNALQILEATLNLREIRILDGCPAKFNEAETLAALNKQKIIQEEFKRWLPLDEDRVWMVEDKYNKMFTFKQIKADGRNLTFPEMSDKMSLFPYQKDAVQRIMTTPNTLLAFDVGSGKTYIMIAAAMKMRQEGISRKNLFVVPNHIVGQWEKIFTDLYPRAKLLTVEPKSFRPEMRSKVLHQMKTGDYDGIIIAYSCFDMIPVSRTVILNQMDKSLQEVEEALNHARKNYRYNDLENERSRIRDLVDKFMESMEAQLPEDVTFDQMEINTLFLDEAHNYKNLPLNSKMKNLRGINITGSRKCQDMMFKIRAVQEANDGRGAVLATGTPLCNSIADTYAMQMYLQPRAMKYRHLDVFDNWVKTFAQPEQTCEIDVDASKFRFVNRFVRFYNLPELSAMFSQIAVFHAADEDTDLPVLEGYSDVAIPQNPVLAEYMQSLTKRTELIRGGKVLPSVDNMLKVSIDGRKAALSLKLVGKRQDYNEFSKVHCCVEEVLKIYRTYERSSQLIFCDYSTPKPSEFCVYQELKEHLITEGIPSKEIAFIHSFKSESTRLKMFEDVNKGKVRILIGSTFKLGIGANVQTRLKAIHHLDVPWRPADMVQREGRIIRRGNENESIRIFRYVAKGSFDSYCWQVLENKQKFISQFLSGSTYERSAPDLETNILSYAEVKALALSQPAMKQLAEIENEIRNQRIILMKDQESMDRLAKEKVDLEQQIKKKKAEISNFSKLLNPVAVMTAEKWKVLKKEFEDYLKPWRMDGKNEWKDMPFFQDVKGTFIAIRISGSKPMTAYLEAYGNIYATQEELEMGNSASGNAQRVVNYLKKMPANIRKMEAELEELCQRLDKAKNELSRTDQQEAKLINLQEERERLIRDLAASGTIVDMKKGK